ncbi:hypothetical protein PY257_01395 [Ramlibacter sp. H39-3-26]|uniref:hypothetical protein n=1 Tax=Curvibacter soli TaxID=3031331 RepID=UPI0023DC6B04|nr:hypothetical protein [Ramlibacter sp. H39-3-26]MDF1483853.1 hypothetical protein [Ramlibacter sp. H39-3-26]
MPQRLLLLLALASLLAGCDIPGLGPDPKVTQREAEARAVGGACRHSMRSLEDCFTLNGKASKAAIFAGWKDMDIYMRDNKIEAVPSVLGKTDARPAPEADTRPPATAAERDRS